MSIHLIEEYIGIGKANAVPRKTLAEMANLIDRKVREAIEEAKHKGVMICSDSSGKGYYIPENEQEIKDYYYREHGRALAILHGLKPFHDHLKAKEREHNALWNP